jgi:LmbE family N-acetylglucosaminyl deacetylase
MKHLTILQLTDGAPRDCDDGKRAGFSDRAAYARERERETRRAIAVLGIKRHLLRYNVPDQESIFKVSDLIRRVEDALRKARLVFTHPYEGGHPDHDTAALVVQLASTRLSQSADVPPMRLEFGSYHHRDGQMVVGAFWPDPGSPEIKVTLDGETRRLKCRALAEYRTQSRVIDWFASDAERYRLAPLYEFSQPPPPGVAHYDLFGWPITAAHWRAHAALALASVQDTFT